MGNCAGCSGPNRKAQKAALRDEVNRLNQQSPMRNSLTASHFVNIKSNIKESEEKPPDRQRLSTSSFHQIKSPERDIVNSFLMSRLDKERNSPEKTFKKNMENITQFAIDESSLEKTHQRSHIKHNQIEGSHAAPDHPLTLKRTNSYEHLQLDNQEILKKEYSKSPTNIKIIAPYPQQEYFEGPSEIKHKSESESKMHSFYGLPMKTQNKDLSRIAQLFETNSEGTPQYIRSMRQDNGEDVITDCLADERIPGRLEPLKYIPLSNYLKDVM